MSGFQRSQGFLLAGAVAFAELSMVNVIYGAMAAALEEAPRRIAMS